MKETKKQLEDAIVIVADSLNMKDAVELLLINVGIYSTVKELVFKMFVEDKQSYFEKDDNVFEAISLIRKYCQEMSRDGEVNFG